MTKPTSLTTLIPPLFQDSSDFSRRSAKLNNYYESFRRDMISILGNVKLPDEAAAASAARGGGAGGYGGAVGADPSLTATNSSSGTYLNCFLILAFSIVQT